MRTEAPSYPPYVDEGLKQIDASFHLRWNPRKFIARPGHIDGAGKVVPPSYEPRYEVWGKDAEGEEYCLFTCDKLGQFQLPGEWLLQRLHQLNPANYGGSIGRMLSELVDAKNEALEQVDERDWTNFVEGMTSWYWNMHTPSNIG